MKARRHREITRLLREKAVTSQNQLARLLRAAGFAATQATISRDLEELGALKVRRGGKIAYALPSDEAQPVARNSLRRLIAESVWSFESSGNVVLLKTPPGHAGMVAAAIDRAEPEGIAGTVAGDDTIIVVCSQGVVARRVERKLRLLGEPTLQDAGRERKTS